MKSGDSVVYEQRAVFQRNIKERNAFNAKLPRYDYDEIIDALEGEEDDAADSGGEDYELAG